MGKGVDGFAFTGVFCPQRLVTTAKRKPTIDGHSGEGWHNLPCGASPKIDSQPLLNASCQNIIQVSFSMSLRLFLSRALASHALEVLKLSTVLVIAKAPV